MKKRNYIDIERRKKYTHLNIVSNMYKKTIEMRYIIIIEYFLCNKSIYVYIKESSKNKHTQKNRGNN